VYGGALSPVRPPAIAAIALAALRWLPLTAVALALGLSAAERAGAAFPGANGQVAFQSNRDGNLEIYAMNADGTGQTNLSNNRAVDVAPAWSPDGAKLAFRSGRDGNEEVYVMNADGTGQTNLTNNRAVDVNPAWSPDGARLAFRSNRDGNDEIYVMNADGTGQTRVTDNPASDDEPAWSPDGTKLAFTSDRDGNFEVYVMNADGTGQANLTNDAGFDGEPAWSPDGTRLAFTSDRDGNAEVYVMNADGTGQTRLLNNAAEDGAPAWSPDGSKLAFHSLRDGNFEIYAMNADGTRQTNLTESRAGEINPDWGPLPRATVLGVSVNLEPRRGQVFVSEPSATAHASQTRTVPGLRGRRFVPLREARHFPVGSLLDTRSGTVRLTSARDRRGKIQTGDFTAGVFQVLQSRRASARGLTELRLAGGTFRRCRPRARRAPADAARLSRRTIRRLRASARGRFRTRGRYSAATVRGTDFEILDRCDGTLTRVRRGRVAVRDLRRRKTIVVRAGKSYLARAPR
jgi:TolB protein